MAINESPTPTSNASRRSLSADTTERGPRLRLVRPVDRPHVSVLLVAPDWRPEFERSVRAAVSACASLGAELILAVACSIRIEPSLAATPQLRIITAPADADTRALRHLAVLEASGDIMIFADPSCTCSASWRDCIKRARSRASTERTSDSVDWMAALSLRGVTVADAELSAPARTQTTALHSGLLASWLGLFGERRWGERP
jgi:hypothetical protein